MVRCPGSTTGGSSRRPAVLWVAGVGLLVLTLVIGIVRGGARRWIPLGLFNLQPSELVKIACVLRGRDCWRSSG